MASGPGGDPGGLMWVGLAAGEPSPRRSRSTSRTRAGADGPPLSPRAGMGNAPTLREQMSAAAAAANDTAAASDAAPADPELVSLALRVRQHSGAPYDARAPRAPQPPPAGGPPAWCVIAPP